MPHPAFFRDMGLFVENNFLDALARAQVQEQIRCAQSEKGTIVDAEQKTLLVDESRRRVLSAKFSRSVGALVERRLREIKPACLSVRHAA